MVGSSFRTELRASQDIFVTMSTTKSTTQGGGETLRVDVFVVLLIPRWEAGESISDAISSVAACMKYAHACIMHGPGRESLRHAHESLYVAQGCSSSGSLLFVVFVASPADMHYIYTYNTIYRIALWSLHVIHDNLWSLVRDFSGFYIQCNFDPKYCDIVEFTMHSVERQVSRNNVLPYCIWQTCWLLLKELLRTLANM